MVFPPLSDADRINFFGNTYVFARDDDDEERFVWRRTRTDDMVILHDRATMHSGIVDLTECEIVRVFCPIVMKEGDE